MTAALLTIDIRTRQRWRAWLAKHHASSPGIWLVRHKQHTAVKSMPYEDVVREALCFGWVDSLIKRLDDDCYAIKVTPRKPDSKWSEINRRRWNELEADGLLAAPGLAAAPTRNRYAPKPAIPELPAYIANAFKTNARAWQHFQTLAPTYRRHFVVWIHLARRPETRERRIRESIELLSAGKKLGLKQRRLVRGTWGVTENNRKARFYELTAAGRRQLAAEKAEWGRMASIIQVLLHDQGQ